MPDPDDDVELPPTYDFGAGLTGFDASAGKPSAPGIALPPTPGPPSSGPPGQPPSPSHPVVQPGSPVPTPPASPSPPAPPSGPAAYGTAPGQDPGTPSPPVVRAPSTTPYSASLSSSPSAGSAPSNKGRWFFGSVATAVVVVSVVGGLNAGNRDAADPSGGGGGRSGTGTTSPVVTQPDTSEQVWSVDLELDALLVDDPVNGASVFASPDRSVVVVGDQVVARLADDPWDETTPATIRLYSLADGTSRDLTRMDRPRCAVVPDALGRGTNLVTCGGGLDGEQVVATFDVVSGEEVRRWDVPEAVAMIATTATGVVTLDAVDPDTGETELRWYTNDGARAWSEQLADLPADIREHLLYEYDDGFEVDYGVDLRAVGQSVLLTSGTALVAGTEEGVQAVRQCWSGAVIADVYVCEDSESDAVEGVAATGDVLWRSDEMSVHTSFYDLSPIVLTNEYETAGDGEYTRSYRVVDPLTGRQGEPLDLGQEHLQVAGTPATPLLFQEEEREEYDEPTVLTLSLVDPATLDLAWTTTLQSRQYPTVTVAGDRILVDVERGSWTVLDAATGEVVGGMANESSVAAVVDGGVVLQEYDQIRRVTLP